MKKIYVKSTETLVAEVDYKLSNFSAEEVIALIKEQRLVTDFDKMIVEPGKLKFIKNITTIEARER